MHLSKDAFMSTHKAMCPGCPGYEREIKHSKAKDKLGICTDISVTVAASVAMGHAKQKLSLNAMNRTLQEADLQTKSFDHLSLFNVIEYSGEQQAMPRDGSRVLGQGGVLALKTQIIDSMGPQVCVTEWMLLHDAPRRMLSGANTIGLLTLRSIQMPRGYDI